MRKNITAVIALVLALVLGLSGCRFSPKIIPASTEQGNEVTNAADDASFKVGFIFANDSGSTSTIARVAGIRKMQVETGLADSQVLMKFNVKKAEVETVVAKMVDKGCKIIFSCDYRYEEPIYVCAQNYTDIQFCQEDGMYATEVNRDNFHSYYSRIYEAYYVAGAVLGIKIVDMINNGRASSDRCRLGFVASENTPEAISAFTAFYQGVHSITKLPSMYVRFVGKTGVYDKDGEAAKQLAAAGVIAMSQFTSTTAVAAVCAESGIYYAGNEVNMIDQAPKVALCSAITDYSVYYKYAVDACINGKAIDTDWVQGYAEGVNMISQLNDAHVANDTQAYVRLLEKKIRKGKVKIFDTKEMTVEGESLYTLINDKKGDYKKLKKYLNKDGNFEESSLNSKPVFDVMIDGIEESTYDYLADKEAEEAAAKESDYDY